MSADGFSPEMIILGGTGSGVCLVVSRLRASTLLSDLFDELPQLFEFVYFVTFSCFLYFALLFLNQTCELNDNWMSIY